MYKIQSKYSKEIKDDNDIKSNDDEIEKKNEKGKEKEKDNKNKNKSKIEEKEEQLRKKKAQNYVHSSYKNFLLHYKDGNNSLQNDIKNCKKMEIHSDSRDFIWFFFLGILPYKLPLSWSKIITDERSLYLTLKNKLITKDISDFIDTKKIKDKYSLYYNFKNILTKEDYNLLDIIKIDVNRTFQKVQLFRLDKIQRMLITILYIFSKQNKEIGYRQGMSELCAVFIYVLYKEQVLKNAFIKDKETFLFYLFHSNNEFLEHDSYLMFNKFMKKGFINFFKYNDEKYADGFLSQLTSEQKKLLTKEEIINSNDSEFKKRIFLLYYDKFSFIDNNLYKFMSDKIDPEIFIIRWYLCIFTREFPLNQVVHLWDLILLYQFLEEKIYEDDKNNKNNKKEKKKDKKKDNKNLKENDNLISIENDKNDEIKNINENNIKIIDENNNNNNFENNIKIMNENEIISENNNIIINENIIKDDKNIIINNNDNDKNNDNNKVKNDEILNNNYNFIDYIALSMIIKLKNLIIKKKSSSELMAFLMKYPQDIDLREICQKAIDIYNKVNPKNKYK